MTDLDDPHLVELMRKGTIPPSLSLRAPPTHIGRSHQRHDVIGITKEEVSKRYIVKLQRERMKNNEAVNKSMDNLPIKIRQVAQRSFGKTSKSASSTYNSREKDLPSDKSFKSWSNSLNSKPPEGWSNNQYSKPPEPLWHQTSDISRLKKKFKGSPKNKAPLPAIKSNDENGPRHVSFEPYIFDMPNTDSYEIPYIFQTGFQGHQNRNKPYRRKPIAFGQLTNKSNEDFQKRYKRVLDSDQNPHFVKSSLIKGQHFNNSIHHFGTVYNRRQIEHGEELFAIKSVQKINDPFIFTSPASPTRVPNPSLYSECISPELDEKGNELPMASRKNSVEFLPPSNDIRNRENDRYLQDDNNNMKGNDFDRQNRITNSTKNIPLLSIELLKVHENAMSTQTNKTQGVCNLTDISERDEGSFSKASRSEVGQDMRIAVRINYKSREDVIKEHRANLSPASKSNKGSHTPRSRCSESMSTERPLESLRVEGRLYGEKLDSQKSDELEVESNHNKKENTGENITSNKETNSPVIVVDLNRLKTVRTLSKSPVSENKENKSESPNNIESTDKTDISQNKDEFFLTNNDEDESLDGDFTSPVMVKNHEAEVKCLKQTPRTEVDDSGISVSTFENDAFK